MGESPAHERIGVIMAGGVGERFWPVSRPKRPKQLLPLGPGGRTLLEATASRIGKALGRQRLLIVTGRPLRRPILDAGLPLGEAQVVAEPAKRNTMGAVAWATAWTLGRLGLAADTTMAVTPADQHVGDEAAFSRDLQVAMAAAEELDALVTIGIEPTRPETGYGYIEAEDAPLTLQTVDAGDSLRRVARFCEKPDPDTAHQFLHSGRFLWNSGMFFWRISSLLAELERANEEVASATRAMAEALADGDQVGAERLFAELPNTSVDYALMERAEQVLVVRGSFPWDDIGAWDAWRRVSETDERGNTTHGEPMLIDCDDCAVYEELQGVPVAVIGMTSVVVAVSEGGVLVAPLERAQEVRDVVQARRHDDCGGSDQ
ncbi:MAG: sugar phosphate nucleotidyltransferase [Armatimonadota bacterium]|nr:sugar phosphate nucleotidyltransferase [Armatimonadota bacterium]